MPDVRMIKTTTGTGGRTTIHRFFQVARQNFTGNIPESGRTGFVMRTTEHPGLHQIFLDRWSPRSFSPEPLPDEDILTLFEAARWSPSCFNAQPWYFVFARKEEDLGQFRTILNEGNRAWADRAPLLVVVFSRRDFDRDRPNRWADFDTGASWLALTLQANQMGYHTHAMGGFDQERAYEITNIDRKTYNVICVVAIGRRASPDLLPENLKNREAPGDRRPLEEMIYEGRHVGKK